MSFVKFSQDGEISVGNTLFNIRKFQNEIDKKSTVYIQVNKPTKFSIIDFWYDPKNDVLCVAKPLNGNLSWVQVELAGSKDESKNIIPGPIGYTGSRGTTGYNGSAGYTGSSGLRGFSGYTGSRGPTGYVGSQGEIGPIGYTGSRGFTGTSIDHIKFSSTTDSTGYPNVHGAIDTYIAYGSVDDSVVLGTFSVINGTDAYEQAVIFGYTGTKEKFYQDLYSTGDRLQNSENLYDTITTDLSNLNNQITTVTPYLGTLENVNGSLTELNNLENNLTSLNILSANLQQVLEIPNLVVTPIYYIEGVLGQTDFNFNYTEYDSLKVYYNGRLLSYDDWEPIDGTIIRLSVPVDMTGDVIAIEGIHRIGAVDLVSSSDLQNFTGNLYTKLQVDDLINTTELNTDTKLLSYYNRTEVNSIVQNLKNEFATKTGTVTDFESALL